ncbi:MAG: hypothetical protein JWO82_3005 [Akkermansiaceae bacterium]|nr:hypothetical protein [Akkermansiaceae bacterium]
MNASIPFASLRKLLVRHEMAAIMPALKPLAKRALARRTLQPGASLRCVAGRSWVTTSPGGEDIVLRAGERYQAGRRTVLLIEALEDSVIQ